MIKTVLTYKDITFTVDSVELKGVASYIDLVAEVSVGYYLIRKEIEDAFVTADELRVTFSKFLSDGAELRDAPSFAFGKRLYDSTLANETTSVVLNKVRTDSFSVGDSALLDAGKIFNHSASFVDSNLFSTTKNLSDVINATDDFLGESNVDDDQNILFSKVIRDNSFTNENAIKLVNKNHTDSASFTDSGSVLWQDYVSDPSYFAEDYVGNSQTF